MRTELITAGCLVFAYLLGGLSTGYWLVRWRAGRDLREHGSGSTGATNTGRLLGPAGFTIVLLGDAAKGALAAALALRMGLTPLWCHAAALAVIIGHIFPVQLRFKGGKGISPFMGAWLVLSPLSLIPCLALALLMLAATRRFTLSGLAGLCLLAPSAYWADHSLVSAAFAAATTLLILAAHHDNLQAAFRPAPADRGHDNHPAHP
jgi:glycerol-3-phosphate acyltransferase PlsY